MLWKFYKSDEVTCHYLFGTIHLSTESAYTFSDLAKKYILEAKVYAAEMDLNESFSMDMTTFFLLDSPQKFTDYFRPKQYAKYKSIIYKALDIDLDQFVLHTPFFINNLIAEASLKKTKNLPLDHYLWNFASSQDKLMTGVESFEDQLKIMKNIPIDYQIKSFKDTVKNISQFKKKIGKLNDLYKSADFRQLYKSSKKSMGKIRKLMIYDRNEFMIGKIINISENNPAFFAIGAAHLAGNKGIIALLKKKGYIIKKVEN